MCIDLDAWKITEKFIGQERNILNPISGKQGKPSPEEVDLRIEEKPLQGASNEQGI